MIEGIGKLLESLSSVRLWLFASVCVASAILLWAPDVGPVAFSIVRAKAGIYLVGGLVFGGALFLFGAMSVALGSRAERRRKRVVLTVDKGRSFWAVNRQPDGSEATQIVVDLVVHNGSENSVKMVNVGLLFPLHFGVEPVAVVLVRGGGRDHSTQYAIPPGYTRELSSNLHLRGAHGGRGRRTLIVARFGDAAGKGHWVATTLGRPDRVR